MVNQAPKNVSNKQSQKQSLKTPLKMQNYKPDTMNGKTAGKEREEMHYCPNLTAT